MKKKNKHINLPKPEKDNIQGNDFKDETLKFLIEKRTGGAINIRGIGFQLLYATHTLLTRLTDTQSIRLEGIEDIELYFKDSGEFIQVKTSRNTIDAGAFWDMKILQHFLETYQVTPASRFRLVHNTALVR